MLKIGIIGAGFMGTTHIAGWAETPAEVVGTFARQDAATQNFKDQNTARIYDDLDALINDVDVVDVCTPTHTHHEIVLKAAAAGKHVVCEKPLARTLKQANEMIDACQKAGVRLLVAHVVRFFPEYVLAKTAVERGEIGQVAVV